MKLNETFQLGNIVLNNKIVMAPMTRTRAYNPELKANEQIALYYAQRASAGLIISEGTPINGEAIGYINIPGIYTPQQVEGWKTVTDKVHLNDGYIFAQLWHVGRISHPDLLNGKLPIGPSSINPNFQCYTEKGFTQTIEPKAMTIEDIDNTILDFQKAAVNAMEAGFDGVEIHAANGYLFHQFFMKCSNVRTDAYGGSIKNRARFLFDVLDKMIEKVDASKIGIRLAPDLDQTFGIELDEESEALFEYIIHRLNDYHLAYLHISGFTRKIAHSHARILEIAKKYRQIYKGNYMINGAFDRDTAEKALEDNLADLVSFGAPFISNPDLVERFKKNGPYNTMDKENVYGSSTKGYTDYPFLTKTYIK
ncbi:alkene reductase [Rhizosphaericola mali]|uniref:Alkene reductase n=1 Tax=Rhizosphaericola mali TaxID=2545455 RepID=A0A5P2FZG6_9BACT|nr:alkene reductase [Rhizosphaericola mali]QES88337.1 alkene reductase [Rhizosphaericola mali]